jgi:uncharacterized ubiquitin-like protein YukD
MEKKTYRVRIVHTGTEFSMSLTPDTQGKQIIKAILNNPKLNLVQTDTEGNAIEYKLSSKQKGKTIDDKTLAEAGITDGDVLLLHQQLIAG